MSYYPTIILFIILGLFLSTSCGSASPKEKISYSESANHSEDSLITANFKAKLLRDPELEGRMIQVETVDGTVYLNGLVNNKFEAQRAEKIAGEIPGVISVRNNLRIRLTR